MSDKTVNIIIITIICLATPAQFCRVSADNKTNNSQKDSTLQVYLPREVTIKDSCLSSQTRNNAIGAPLRLGQVGIIRSNSPEDELAAKASEIILGQISMPGQEIVIDRQMVLSRLACNGIPTSKVTLKGAEKITVRQQRQTISSGEFVKLASSFLEQNPPAASVCQWNPIRTPKDFVIGEMDKDIRFSPRLIQSSARNQARVEIGVLSGGKRIGVREVTFRLKYNCLADIPTGAVISPENVKIEKTVSDYPEPVNWRPPYGLLAKRPLPANTVLRPHMVGPLKSPIIVKRNQNVVIRIQRPGLLVTAIGKTMQEARAGEYIKVRNADSQRIILARVNEDGTVEPIF
ncbi:MAG: flagellar basal body P-ring formation chaperone FlgA [Planctomycetota bacterium]|jgi:flagella basal body P-ring formation protein FlgA